MTKNTGAEICLRGHFVNIGTGVGAHCPVYGAFDLGLVVSVPLPIRVAMVSEPFNVIL